MKTLMFSAISAATLAVMTLPGAASAQMAAGAVANSGTNVYGTLGYAYTDLDHAQVGTIQGRLGVRFGPYFGLEGELATGANGDTITTPGGVQDKVHLNSQEAAYGVGFLPLSPNFDLLARVGYGHSSGSGAVPGVTAEVKGDSVNYGVGGQYLFDKKNGVRFDYTREDFQNHGGDANVYALSYVRKF